MGLEEGGGRKTYLGISDGKISQRVTDTTEGAIKKTNKDGTKTYYEKHYPAISGRIVGASKRGTDWGDKLVIDIEDEGTLFALEMPWSSRYSSGFFVCIPNIDVTKRIRFSPYMKIASENGKDIKKTMLYLSYADIKGQDGMPKKIEWFYTKDNPNGLPEMKKIRVKGQDVWDDTERQEFFEGTLNTILLPAIDKNKRGVSSPMVKSHASVESSDIPDQEASEDDLPF